VSRPFAGRNWNFWESAEYSLGYVVQPIPLALAIHTISGKYGEGIAKV
jgi:hypothetical protein